MMVRPAAARSRDPVSPQENNRKTEILASLLLDKASSVGNSGLDDARNFLPILF
jgi:hypothetical protein